MKYLVAKNLTANRVQVPGTSLLLGPHKEGRVLLTSVDPNKLGEVQANRSLSVSVVSTEEIRDDLEGLVVDQIRFEALYGEEYKLPWTEVLRGARQCIAELEIVVQGVDSGDVSVLRRVYRVVEGGESIDVYHTPLDDGSLDAGNATIINVFDGVNYALSVSFPDAEPPARASTQLYYSEDYVDGDRLVVFATAEALAAWTLDESIIEGAVAFEFDSNAASTHGLDYNLIPLGNATLWGTVIAAVLENSGLFTDIETSEGDVYFSQTYEGAAGNLEHGHDYSTAEAPTGFTNGSSGVLNHHTYIITTKSYLSLA